MDLLQQLVLALAHHSSDPRSPIVEEEIAEDEQSQSDNRERTREKLQDKYLETWHAFQEYFHCLNIAGDWMMEMHELVRDSTQANASWRKFLSDGNGFGRIHKKFQGDNSSSLISKQNTYLHYQYMYLYEQLCDGKVEKEAYDKFLLECDQFIRVARISQSTSKEIIEELSSLEKE